MRLALPSSIVAFPPAAASASPAGSSSPATQAQAEALPLPQPGAARRGAHHRPRLAPDARREDRLHGRARIGTPPRRRRLARHRGLPRGRAGRAEQNWGQRDPTPTTQFPQAYGLGETWDPDLVRRVAAQEAQEARYLFQSGRYGRSGIIVRAPNADLGRDPRWGRTEECYGEDPYLAGTMAVAFVRGLQGDHPRYWQAAALLKHFLANSNEDGAQQSSSDFDERLLREYYSVPFRSEPSRRAARGLSWPPTTPTTASRAPSTRSCGRWPIGNGTRTGSSARTAAAFKLLVTAHRHCPDLPAGRPGHHPRWHHPVPRRLSGERARRRSQRGLLTEADIDRAIRGNFRVMLRLGLLDPPEMVPYSSIGESDGP